MHTDKNDAQHEKKNSVQSMQAMMFYFCFALLGLQQWGEHSIVVAAYSDGASPADGADAAAISSQLPYKQQPKTNFSLGELAVYPTIIAAAQVRLRRHSFMPFLSCHTFFCVTGQWLDFLNRCPE